MGTRSGSWKARGALFFACALAAACGQGGAPRAAPAGQGPLPLLPTTTAAAELVRLLAGPEEVAALPEQVDTYSVLDFQSGGWERLPRFSKYVAEPMLVYAPGLVVTHRWQSAETSALLVSHGVPVLALESGTSWPEVRGALLELAKRVGRVERADAALVGLDARVVALKTRVPAAHGLRALVYTHDGSSGWAACSRTTADGILALVGLRNAGSEAGLEGHAALGFERLLQIDPDLIVVASKARGESGSPTQDVIESTAELATLRVRKNKRIAVLSAALLSSDSQCLVDAGEALAAELERLLR